VWTEIKDKKITVVGLGRSGVGAANLLSEIGSEVTVTDSKTEDELKGFIAKLNPSVRLALEGHPEDLFVSTDMLVVSPGVPLGILPILKAKEKGVPIIGEMELAYQMARDPKLLAVAGTNGKSTTTTLLNLILRKGGFRTIIGGNIGNALTEEILKLLKGQGSMVSSQKALDYIVAEVSSFQLESIKDFRPKVASILNITPDHLDRYHSFKEYMDAEARVFDNQREDDFLVLNADDPGTIKIKSEKLKAKSEKPRVFYFSRRREVEGIYFEDGVIYLSLSDFSLPTSRFPLINADEIKIKGVHNLENAMAASVMALLAGCPLEAVIDSLREFQGLEHRLEFVRDIDGVGYFNDLKGTNVGAVIKSLESFREPIILIAGGRDKSGDFSPLRYLVRERVKAIVLIGEAGEKIKRALGDLTWTATAKDLAEAINISRSIAAKGDVVLLSPACASFDMFIDFEDRGGQFKKIVMEMT